MTLGFTLIETNLGVGLSELIVLVYTLACFIFAAKDFKTALMALFVGNAGIFIWFYSVNLRWNFPLYMMLVGFILLLLSFFPVSNTSQTGGLI